MFPSATNLSNFLLLKAAPWSFTKDGRISAAAPRTPSLAVALSKPCTLSCCRNCAPAERKKRVFGKRLAHKQPLLSCSQATKALLGRPALSPEPSRPPLCSRTQRGRKSRSVFASHVGTQALYTLQWHCGYFVSLTNRRQRGKRPAKTVRSFDNWELYKFRKSSEEDLKLFFISPFLRFFFLSASPIVRLLKSCVQRSHCEGDKIL